MTPAEARALMAEAPKRKSKWGNKPVVVDGVRYDSQKEFRRWSDLQMLARHGDIANLRRQVPFDLEVNGIHVCRYVADHVFDRAGQTVVEDVKSEATAQIDVFKIKRNLMKAVHGIDVVLA